MPLENPWSDIERAIPGQMNAKRIDPTSKHDFFWACNADGRYAFLFNTQHDLPDLGAPPKLRGITVGYYRPQRQFQLILENREDWQIFRSLCDDLTRATEEMVSPRTVMDTLLARLIQWQRLLSRGVKRLLDDREIRGLIGELLFLRDELITKCGPSAIGFWQGPSGRPQDFALGPYLFEIKTHLAGDSPKVVISCPEQLWAENATLYLAVTPLARSGRHGMGAVTLPLLVDELSSSVRATAYHEAFESRLIDAGYFPSPEYDDEIYVASPTQYYEVAGMFPRISANAIRSGIEDVRYSLKISACAAFGCSLNWDAIVGSLA